MSIQPLITFKAGQCELTARNGSAQQKVKPIAAPGYVYLYQGEDEFVHFCWRARDKTIEEPELDLIMIPGDGSFLPYIGKDTVEDSDNVKSPTDGRIFVLKFSSSSQRYLFWLQSKSQHPKGDPSWFSERDLKIGQVVDILLTGEEVDVQAELSNIPSRAPPGGDDDDETMEDVEGTDHSSNRRQGGGTGGAGPGATGGDIREEGEESREGGADGGRAAAPGDVSAIVQNFVNSLKGGNGGDGRSGDPFTTLLDLLWPSHTISTVNKGSDELIDALCANLPTTPFLLEAEVEDVDQIDPNSETAQMAIQTLDQEQKKEVLTRVLRAPQLRQALGSLTEALRTGALPTVSQALKIDVENGGFMKGGGMPLGGGDAVKAFLEGVKRTVEKEEDEEMDTS